MNQVNIPSLLQPVASMWLKWEVKKKSGLEIDRVAPIEFGKKSNVPLLLGHSSEDELIPIKQARAVLDAYGCRDKKLVTFTGEHNDVRPMEWVRECLLFVEQKFQMDLNALGLRTTGEERVEHMARLDDFLEQMGRIDYG
jgi:hypothetical protein